MIEEMYIKNRHRVTNQFVDGFAFGIFHIFMMRYEPESNTSARVSQCVNVRSVY